MKIKKILLIIIVSLFCFIPVVEAKNNIVIKSITPDFSTDLSLLNSLKGVDVTFNDLDQTIKYDVLIQNNTNNDLYVNSMQISGQSQEFIKYSLDEESRSKVIKADSKETITFSVSTNSGKLAGKNLNDTINFKFLLNGKIENPNTNSNLITTIILVIIGAVAITFIMTKFNNKKGTIATVIVCFMLLGTSFVFADDTKIVEMNGKVNYRSQNYLEPSGRSISSGNVSYNNSKDIWTSTYYNKIKNININIDGTEITTYKEKFDLTTDDKNRIIAYLVENGDTNIPYDLYIVSKGVIYTPEDATGLFSFLNVETINGFENLMFDNTINMSGMFTQNEKLHTLNISNLNTEKVINTSYMFYRCFALDGIDESKFNLTKVENKTNMISESKLYNIIEKNVNGNNLQTYIGKDSENYQNKVYYYTGNVNNNNVKFANFCWKIVRTTETGGVKLVYNGLPDSNGQCNNTGTAGLIGTSQYNSSEELNGTIEAFSYMNSDVKKVIDEWYKNNLISYQNKIDKNVVYCNDRQEIRSTSTATYYGAHDRIAKTKDYSLHCEQEDSLSAVSSNTTTKLTYPIALLTADELALAGIRWDTSIYNYLENNAEWWTMSAARIMDNNSALLRTYNPTSPDVQKFYYPLANIGIRPTIGLTKDIKISGGYGTTDKPYTIK